MNEKIRWGTERRLEFIEFRVFWEGGVNRSDVTEKFGVSVPQASSDLSLYQKLAPANLIYNASEKRYTATDEFTPLFLELSADRYLAELRLTAEGQRRVLDSWMEDIPSVDAMPIPTRRVKPHVLRELLAIVRSHRSVEISYQSMNPNRPDRIWRRITPHAFGFDGTRWHLRAFCHESGVFKDFLLSRCDAVRGNAEPGADPEDDEQWNEIMEVVLAPNPRLSAGQRQAIADDYAMSAGQLHLHVRRALLYYLNRRLRLDHDPQKEDPAENPLVVVNRARFDQALKR